MAKSKASVAELVSYDNESHTLVVKVKHTEYASYSRSVIPSANKVLHKFMSSPEGRAWRIEGYNGFTHKLHTDDYGTNGGYSFLIYTLGQY